ncbi:translation initiation factor IF-2 N-terminal domain-containing protein [Lactococcus fujiensis]|uniref:translation initiation factor IF-2 N-terminal domain-containing protein n=1 Tax=Lactococcus fujiensis TaxID=610251 RepID=UPI0006D2008F|nr:translation initiation factor IF-2 N-terminal domain-containing protein [Lactococcus fujiensis]
MAEIKKRINQIAKETGVSSNALVEKAKELQLTVKSHSSSITENEEKRLLEALNIKPVVVEKNCASGKC